MILWIMPTSSLTGHSIHGGYYDKLAKAFSMGRLDVGIAPAVITSLKDPYGPEHKKYTLHPHLALWDYSLYKGRLYLYFGAAPALLLYLPYQLITGTALSDGLALITLLLLTTGGCVAITLRLRKKSFALVPTWIFGLAGLVLVTNSLWFILVARARTYEIPVAACAAAMTWAIWATVLAATPDENRRKNLAIASLLYGIAIASRPHFIVAICAIYVTMLVLFRKDNYSSTGNRLTEKILDAFAMFTPFCMILLTMAAYNYFRFDNIFEFGVRYQMGEVDQSHLTFFDPSRIPSGLWISLIHLPHRIAHFPYLAPVGIHSGYLRNGRIFIENPLGFLWVAPWLPAAFWIYARQSNPRSIDARPIGGQLNLTIGLYTLVGLVMLAMTSSWCAYIDRYASDFGYFLSGAGLLVLLHGSASSGLQERRFCRTTISIAAIWGCYMTAVVTYPYW